MHRQTIRLAHRFFFATALLLLLAAAVHPQSSGTVAGRWSWQEIARKDKPQTQFSIVIKRVGNVVSGTYSVDEFINGKWQGEDGNQTAFTGNVKGNTANIKFDPAATVAGYQENVAYHAPHRGRPSTATLTLKGNTLLWRFSGGPRIDGVPNALTLKREPTPKQQPTP
jgi:hypothetical protein